MHAALGLPPKSSLERNSAHTPPTSALRLRLVEILREAPPVNTYHVRSTKYIVYKVPLREEARGVAQERNEKHPA